MQYSVAQNTSFLTIASVAQKAISFFYFIIIARLVGVENTGQYFFAITFTTIFTVVADFGMGPVLTRETARHPEQTQQNFNTVFWTKILFGVFAYGLVIFFANLLNYGVLTKELIYISGITMFFDNLQGAFYSIFRARLNLIYESVGIIGSQIVTMVIGTISLINHWPLFWLIIAYTVPSFLSCFYGMYFCFRNFALRVKFYFDKKVLKNFIILAVPFAFAGIIGRLYSYSDTLIMSKMLSLKEVGWWSVPYKITFAFQFVPMALSASVYPVFSNLFLTDKTQIGPLFEKSWRYLFAIVFPLTLGIIAISDKVVVFVYGKNYAPSVTPLRILLVSLMFGFLSFITGALLNATNRQKIQTSLLAAALIVNVVLNLFLLPVIGINGAAFAALAGNIILCVGGYYFARQNIFISFANILKYGRQTLVPAVFMAILVYVISRKVNFLFAIPVGAAFYFTWLYGSGFLNKEMIIKLFGKAVGFKQNK